MDIHRRHLSVLLRLSDDLFIHLIDVWLGFTGSGLACSCARLRRIVGGRYCLASGEQRRQLQTTHALGRTVGLQWNDCVGPIGPFLAQDRFSGLRSLQITTPVAFRDFTELMRRLGSLPYLRRFVWKFTGGRPDPGDIGAVIDAAGSCRRLESVSLCVRGCGLDTAEALDSAIVGGALRKLRLLPVLRDLTLDLSGNRIGATGVRAVAETLSSRTRDATDASSDPLRCLRLRIAACFPVGEVGALDGLVALRPLRRLTEFALDTGRLRHTEADLCVILSSIIAGWVDSLEKCSLCLGASAGVLGDRLFRGPDSGFAVFGRCVRLRSLRFETFRMPMTDANLAEGVLRPLRDGCPVLCDLSLRIGGARLGLTSANILAEISLRLHTLRLSHRIVNAPGRRQLYLDRSEFYFSPGTAGMFARFARVFASAITSTSTSTSTPEELGPPCKTGQE